MRTTAAPGRFGRVRHGTATDMEPGQADEMSRRVLGIIDAYRMGPVVEARSLCPKAVPKPVPEAPPRPAEGFVRNGVYHVADTAPTRRT